MRSILPVITTAVVSLIPASSESCSAQENVDREQLPTLEEMDRPPSFRELMDSETFDWVVLKFDNQVIVSEAIFPRPDTLQKLRKERDRLATTLRRNAEQTKRLSKLRFVEIQLPGDPAEYRVRTQDVREIIGMEDLMLERVDMLLQQNDVSRAYDLLRRVESLAPGWKKITPHFEALLLREADVRRDEGKPFAALALLQELHTGNPHRPEIPEKVQALLDPIIQEAVNAGEYRKARWFIGRLAETFPQSTTVSRWSKTLQQLSRKTLEEAAEQAQNSEHRAAAQQAALARRIWPIGGHLRSVYESIALRQQVLYVGVSHLSESLPTYPIPLAAHKRHLELTSVPLFEADTTDEMTHYRSSHVGKWDPRDLGRQVTFSLRTTRPYWQSQPVLSASQIADTLVSRLQPGNPLYNPRLASFVDGYTVRSPTDLEVRFSRVPLNMAALFRFPVTGVPPDVYEKPTTRPELLSTRFVLSGHNNNEQTYRRSVPEPDGLNPGQYHVAEITERRYVSRHELIQAFRRGDVDAVPTLRPWEVDPVTESGLGNVRKFAFPECHLIVLNPRSEILQSAPLRRSLSLAIDRERILRTVILRDDAMKYGRVSSCAWPSESYASSRLVPPPLFDLRLAFALRFAAEEQLRITEKQRRIRTARQSARDSGSDWHQSEWRSQNNRQLNEAVAHIKLPTLRLICPPDEVIRTAANRIIDLWSRAGLCVRLISPQSSTPESGWDLMYRTAVMEEPLLDIWEVLLTDSTLDMSLLYGYPDWLRQELTGLDHASSLRDARQRLHRIHRDLAAQAFLIPLWEVDQFVALRSNVSGFRNWPISVYDNIERWVVKP